MGNKKKNSSVAGRFSKAAKSYNKSALFQQGVASKLVSYLPGRNDTRRILEIGCGTGFLTRELLFRYPDAHVDALDISFEMLRQAKSELQPGSKVNFILADINEFVADKNYDLIVSSSSLQWVSSLGEVFEGFNKILSPNGAVFFSLMLSGTLSELHGLRTEIAPHKPAAQALPERAEVVTEFAKAGFEIEEDHVEESRVYYSDAFHFFRTLRELGFTATKEGLKLVPLSRMEVERLVDEYQLRFRDEDDKVPATYKVLYVGGRSIARPS